jgi:hypothetical protein
MSVWLDAVQLEFGVVASKHPPREILTSHFTTSKVVNKTNYQFERRLQYPNTVQYIHMWRLSPPPANLRTRHAMVARDPYKVFDKFPNYHMKILLGDFNAKVGREDIFKPTIGNVSLHEINNDNGVRVVDFATSKNVIVKSTMFPHHNIHKFTWTSPDEKTHKQIDHILIDRRRHPSILDVRSLKAADCDTDYYLVVAKLRERLAARKQTMHRVHMERFNLKKLNVAEGKEQYHVEISNRFATLENLRH